MSDGSKVSAIAPVDACKPGPARDPKVELKAAHERAIALEPWREMLEVDEYWRPTGSILNGMIVLSAHPMCAGRLAFDTVKGKAIMIGPMPWSLYPASRDVMGIDAWWSARWMWSIGVPVLEKTAEIALEEIARKQPVSARRHPTVRQRILLPRMMTRAAEGDQTDFVAAAAKRKKRDAPPAAPGGKTIIRLGPDFHRVVDESEAALIAAKAGFYQRDMAIVRPGLEPLPAANDGKTVSYRIMPVSARRIRDALSEAATYIGFDMKRKKLVEKGCPKEISEMLLARAGEHKFAPLMGVITSPTLRGDGTILDQPGYDVATGLLFDPRKTPFPPIPAEPSRDEAFRALALLKGLFGEVAFVTAVDLAVALSAALTAVVRQSMTAAPLVGITSPTKGSGKSFLVDIFSLIATGERAPVITWGKKEEEVEKRVDASMIAGDAIITIDNVTKPLASSWLAVACTQPRIRIRWLGLSKNIDVFSTSMLFATGNGLELGGDMSRRCLFCEIDPGLERPEERAFDLDPRGLIRANRGAYVVACLTILRAYICAGRPGTLSRIGSFEEWSRLVRGALVWLGEADPVASMEKAREVDLDLKRTTALVRAWHAALGEEPVGVRGLCEAAARQTAGADGPAAAHPGFREALIEVAADKRGGLSRERLGWWLRKHRNRVIAGFILEQAGELNNQPLWSVRRRQILEP